MSKVKDSEKKLKILDKNIKKGNPDGPKNKESLSKMRLSLPQITPSAQKLQKKISEFKSQHAQVTKTLQQAILNNNLYRSVSAAQLKNSNYAEFLDRRHSRKQKSLVNLQKKMQKRIELNEEAQNQLLKMEEQVNSKKLTVSKRLSQIQARNLQKIQQIENFEKQFLEKVKWELNKNLQKEKKLKKQFEKIKQENIKIVKTKQFENKLDKDAWKSIMDEKINIENLMRNQKEKQLKLIKQKNPETAKKQQKVVAAKEEEKKVIKQRVKLDPKEAGRQYLDFAKKKGSNGPKQSKEMRKNYMNINLKVINYENEILERIGNNDGMLSKKTEENINIQPNVVEKDSNVQIHQKNLILSQNEMEIIPILQQKEQDSEEDSEMSDIQKTAKLVKHINKNIEKIEEKYEKSGKQK